MDSLLHWAITNTTSSSSDAPTEAPPTALRRDLDPGIVDAILGKPDVVLMQEALARARDESLDEDTRVEALDDLEMLVEPIDNASNLEQLGMWTPIHDLISSSPSDAIKTQAVWVAGTAVQNNPKAQHAYKYIYQYLALNPIPGLLAFLHPKSARSSSLRSKSVYALCGLLTHNAPAVSSLSFSTPNGWQTFKDALSDSDISVRRKTTFLFTLLLSPPAAPHADTPWNSDGTVGGGRLGDVVSHLNHNDPMTARAQAPVHANTHASMLADPKSTETADKALQAMTEYGILGALVSALVSPSPHGPDGETEGDVDLDEKIVRVLYTFVVVHKGEIDEEDKGRLREFFERTGEKRDGEIHGLDESEFEELREAIKV
ncbi:Fes1-domain-containing protein [Peniophora sp. CONT]|nr:Fes1-domain-containing protein [Peniophora sp. CONT]